MTTYAEAGVNIKRGDLSAAIAYGMAQKTFKARQNMIGRPVDLEGGFTGALHFGDFLLVQNDDGTGSKSMVAEALGKYDTLGYDLLAMVADDAVCVGAEVVSITNTIDVKKVDPKVIEALMKGLVKACLEQNIVIAGGEIAELGSQVKRLVWNASAVGIVEKEKLIMGQDIRPGDKIIGLQSRGFRSNGLTLVRYILKKHLGPGWEKKPWEGRQTWGEAVLVPSRIYHACVLEMVGRFKKERRVRVAGIAHITGGGIPGNLARILKKTGRGALLDNLFPSHKIMLDLQKMGEVDDREAYRSWNMGSGMILAAPESEVKTIIEIARKHQIPAEVIGEVAKEPGITLISQGYFERGRKLSFS